MILGVWKTKSIKWILFGRTVKLKLRAAIHSMIVRNVVEFLNCHIDANDINHGQNCKVCLDQLDCEMAPLFCEKEERY